MHPCSIGYHYKQLINFQEGENIEGWNPCSSAAYCLTKFAECWKELVLNYVGQFFGEEISKPEWYCKNAAVLALGSILEHVSEPSISQMSPVVWPCLMECLSDAQIELRDTVCWVLGKLSRADPKFIFSKKSELLPRLIERLDDDFKVAKNASIAITETIDSLRVACGPVQANSTMMPSNHSSYSDEDLISLIKVFLKNAQRGDVGLTVMSFSSISSIVMSIEGGKESSVAQFAFSACFEALKSAYEGHQQNIVSSVILTIQTIIEYYGMDQPKMCTDMMSVVQTMCQNPRHLENMNIMPDVLTLISSIAVIIGDEFIPYLALTNKLIVAGLTEFLFDIDVILLFACRVLRTQCGSAHMA